VGLLGLERSTDEQLCDFAAENDYVLVSKDDDFPALVVARGYRPKLIQMALGNASNEVLSALLGAADRLESALSQSEIRIAVINRDVRT
jgi:predicted nuclease of predicted toxin-antitoxin system